mgnify:CR=1 FL=1
MDAGTHKEIIVKPDYLAPKYHNGNGQIAKYDFQKESKVLYLECAGYKTLIQLRKCRFCCKVCRKMAIAETSLVKKNHQISKHRQSENHSKINRESPYDSYCRKSIYLHFDSHS